MLTSFSVNGYRSCKHTSFRPETNVSVLIGPNGSGKTNFLNAIALLANIHGTTREKFERRAKKLKLHTVHLEGTIGFDGGAARVLADVAIEVTPSNKDSILDYQFRRIIDFYDERSITFLTPFWNGVGEVEYPNAKRIGKPAGDAPTDQFWDSISDVKGNITTSNLQKELSLFERELRGIRYLAAATYSNPSLCPVSFEFDPSEPLSKSDKSDDQRLLIEMYICKREVPMVFDEFLDLVGRNGLGIIDSIELSEYPLPSTTYQVGIGGKTEKKERKRVLVVPRVLLHGQSLSPNQLASGVYKTIALLFHIVTGWFSVLLLEEPEVCLHHGLLTDVMSAIQSYSTEKQVIISTHSDQVLNAVPPESVFVVSFSKENGTLVKAIPEALSRDQYKALKNFLSSSGNLGEYWRAGGLESLP